jgi:hypothetical protein
MAGTAVGTRETVFDSGRRLPASALARFVALAGAVPDAIASLSDSDSPDSPQPDLSVLGESWWRIDLDQAAAMGARLDTVTDIGALCTRLDRLWVQASTGRPVRILLWGGPPDLDTTWLTQLLTQHGPVDAVVFDQSQWRASAIDWPMRVGIAPSAEGRVLAQTLRDGRHRELYEPLLARGGQGLDILLFPGPLSQALRSARRSILRRASLVVVLGPFDHPGGVRAMRELASCWTAATVTVCGLDSTLWPECFYQLVAALSHNLPTPLAVFEAYRRTLPGSDSAMPVVLSDVGFAEHQRPLDMAMRLAEALRFQFGERPLVAPPELGVVSDSPANTTAAGTFANALESAAGQWPWTSETQGALLLVRTRRALEQQLGPIELRHHTGVAMAESPEAMSSAEPPPPEASPDPAPPRHVKFDLWPVDAAEPPRTSIALAPDNDHRLEVFIAELDVAAQGTADAPLDERLLPPSTDGHELTIVYCPLSPISGVDGRPHIPQPSMAALHLPPRGTSTRVAFTLRCGAAAADFRARLIVLHANRALQTLLFTAPKEGLLRLDAENVYAPGFESPSADAPADLTFVINESPQGLHGLATIGKDAASFIEPAGLDETWQSMTKVLTAAVEEEAGKKGLGIDREQTISLMRSLAFWGAAIRKQLARQHPVAALESARRVQVVEAVSEAFFPVEFLYAGKPPEPTAALCPNALAALGASDSNLHDQCQHKDDKNHVCPMAFWGFHKCIERHTSTGSRDHVVSVPLPGDERLGPFKSVLMGASVNASKEMTGPKGLPATVKKMAPHLAYVTSWDAWSKEVQDAHPDLLVLLSHSGESKDIDDAGALEISTDHKTIGLLDNEYVHTGDGKGPLVLLLGCSTSLSDIPFLSSVRQFHESGAPVVIGTLSIIHGSQAHLIVQRLLELAMDPSRTGQRLDEALLRVRRDLLAQGHGVAFTLSAYGHSSWRI